MIPRLTMSVNNPDILTKEDLIRGFVARQPLLDRLLDDLRREGPDGPPQHQLIVGQRGFGKTTLLRRLAYAVEDDPQLKAGWLPLVFPEEQYNVANLADFWLNCADTLSDALSREGAEHAAETLDKAIAAVKGKGDERTAEALRVLVDAAERAGRKLLLLADNIDIVLDRIGEAREWDFRRAISSERRLHIMGASSRTIEATYNYGRAFYDFFQIHHLTGLDDAEAQALLSRLAELSGSEQASKTIHDRSARIKTIRLLTGGNPRTLVLLYRILSEESQGDVQHDIEQLLDHYTPLYKARFEDLAPQAQVLVDAMAIHWYPLTAGDLHDLVTTSTSLNVNQVSAQLKRLEDLGIVEKAAWYGEDKPEKKTAFLIAERFFNIWYLMRASRRFRRKLVWLVKFLESWFDADELKTQARQLLEKDPDALGRERYLDLALAHSEAVGDRHLRRSLESAGLHAVIDDGVRRMIDFSDLPPELQERAARIERVLKLRQTVLDLEIDWKEIDRSEFWRLLGGSPQYSLEEKARVVDRIQQMTADELEKLFAKLRRADARLRSCFPGQAPAIVHLYDELANGDLADVYDWEGLISAAEKWNTPRLPYIAIRCRTSLYLGPRELPTDECARAEAALRSLTTENSSQVDGWTGLGDLLADRTHKLPEAESSYRRATDVAPDYSWAWTGLGSLMTDLKRYDEAELAHRRSIELNPEDPTAWNELGVVLEEMARHAEAEVAYRRSIELDPSDGVVWDNLGGILLELNRPKEAEAVYRRSIELDPDDSAPWNNLGNALLELNRPKEAEAAYRRSVELDAGLAHSWSNLGRLLVGKRGRKAEAAEALLSAVRIEPESRGEFQEMLGLCEKLAHSKKGRAAALNVLQQAGDVIPNDPEILFVLAHILTKSGKWDEAAPILESLATRELPPAFHTGFFRAVIKAGHAPEAIAILERSDADERWRPLYEALRAARAGTPDYLRRVAPEVGAVALKILNEIAPSL